MTGAEFKKLREVLDLEQTEIAKRLGVHEITISRWENNHNPIPHATAELVKAWAREQRRGQRTKKG